jgi:type IV fimbrial biogenesis protein FimT
MPRAAGPGAAAGFSLVELMVTVSLAAILMAVGIPMLRDTLANNRLAGQTNDMIAAMSLARSQAITLNQSVTFCRTSSTEAVANPTCAGSAGNWQFWLVRTANGTIVRRGTLLGPSLVVTSTLTNDQVVFTSDGLARTNNVLVTGGPHLIVCSSHSSVNNQRQVTIGAGSRVSTAKASGGC